MPDIAYLNGQFLPLADATVSVEDRGFQFGDGVYELVRVYDGVPFRLPDHLVRLERSARAMALPYPPADTAWGPLLAAGVTHSGYGACKVYIQLTRGVAPRDHLFPSVSRPTVVMTFREMTGPDASLRRHGVPVVTRPDLRWARCSIKSVNLLPNILARQDANDAGAFEAILVKDGLVTEGTSSNVCFVRDDTLITPSLSDRLLAGVTRDIVLELAREKGITVEERDVREEELLQMDELFLIGTSIEVLPVSHLNGAPVGSRTPGPITQAIGDALRRLILSETGGTPGRAQT